MTSGALMQVTEIDLHLCHESPSARPIDKAAVEGLIESIKECGLLQPILVRRGAKSPTGLTDAFEVAAGMHRVQACRRLGWSTIPANILEVDDLHAELILIDENLCRNDLSPAERAAATARRKAIHVELFGSPKAKGAHAANAAMGQEHDATAKLADAFTTATSEATGQSARTIRRDAKRGEALGGDVLAKVARTSLDKGEELDALAKCSPEKRRELSDRAAAGEKISAKTELKKEQRAVRERELGARQQALPDRKFGVIVCDPEWHDEVWSEEPGMDRHAANHYPTSSAEIIASRPVASIAAKDCVLWLWTTNQHLRIAIEVLEAWGFEYRSNYCWGKDRISLGRWQRGKHELLLIGTRGRPPCPAPGTQWDSLQLAPKGKHSAKPECFLEMIEQYYPTLLKIELNRRGPARLGWQAWGNESEPASTGPSATLAKSDNFTAPAVQPCAPDKNKARINDAAELPDMPAFLKRGPDGKAPWQSEASAGRVPAPASPRPLDCENDTPYGGAQP